MFASTWTVGRADGREVTVKVGTLMLGLEVTTIEGLEVVGEVEGVFVITVVGVTDGSLVGPVGEVVGSALGVMVF